MTHAYLSVAGISAGLAVLIMAPSFLGEYELGFMVSLMSYVTLATAWAMFSGPTRYISLATVAFFGIGAYTVAVLNEALPYPIVLVVAVCLGALLATFVGFATLRLAGIYFVIFSFGLAELVRQLITWFEVNITGTLGRYIFLPFETQHIYWQLLALAVVTIGLGFWIRRTRLGLALKVIGDDEVVAAHSGIALARTKVMLFVLSASLMTLAGAIQSPRWVYIEPTIVFNPTISFLTVIMALLGGATRLWGPTLGVIPLLIIFEWLSASFPDHFSIVLGVLFIVIVFALPKGVLSALEERIAKLRKERVT
ncbi:branched-chain amino acid ABC transporter permease [Labrenzia sp. PHM005]|uniref:branched-chain amino acid ABC transporter permease n=1 Tax=Labrenzia sp. PHM005 TaxID=2590016 RepID=UPI0011400935|nr:branched-chain amino acid ABC transporter permease [Labrenzia sp. PHM005]QDG78527.1 branched-chain amino acid ABC transporter permease [Labrenzia sp. PHM005]